MAPAYYSARSPEKPPSAVFSYLSRPSPARSCQTTAGPREQCRCGTELWTPPPSLPLDSADGSTSPAGNKAIQWAFKKKKKKNYLRRQVCVSAFLFFVVVVPLCHEENTVSCCCGNRLFSQINDVPTCLSRSPRALNAFIFTKRRVRKQETMIKLSR